MVCCSGLFSQQWACPAHLPCAYFSGDPPEGGDFAHTISVGGCSHISGEGEGLPLCSFSFRAIQIKPTPDPRVQATLTRVMGTELICSGSKENCGMKARGGNARPRDSYPGSRLTPPHRDIGLPVQPNQPLESHLEQPDGVGRHSYTFAED